MDEVERRCALVATALSARCAFSHRTAATLHGLPVGRRPGEELHVVGPRGAYVPRTCRVRLHERSVLPRRELLRGLPVVGVLEAWVGLAELGDHLASVAAGDALAGRLGSTGPMVDAVARRGRGPGTVAARRALVEVRLGARSELESRARVLLGAALLPEPALGLTLPDGSRAALAWPESSLAVRLPPARSRLSPQLEAEWAGPRPVLGDESRGEGGTRGVTARVVGRWRVLDLPAPGCAGWPGGVADLVAEAYLGRCEADHMRAS